MYLTATEIGLEFDNIQTPLFSCGLCACLCVCTCAPIFTTVNTVQNKQTKKILSFQMCSNILGALTIFPMFIFQCEQTAPRSKCFCLYLKIHINT